MWQRFLSIFFVPRLAGLLYTKLGEVDSLPWTGPQLDPLLTHHLPPDQVGLLEALVDSVPWPGPQVDPLLTHHLPPCQVGFLEHL
jgi:hypothetical protein